MSRAARIGGLTFPLTVRGWGLVAMAVLTATAGRLFGIRELYPVAAASLVLVAYAVAWSATRQWRVDFGRRLQPGRLEAGQGADVLITLHNRAATTSPVLTLRDPWDGGRRTATMLVAPMEPDQRISGSYRLAPASRGVFTLGPPSLQATDPLGLARRIHSSAVSSTVVVHPHVEPLRPPRLGAGSDAKRSTALPVPGRSSDEFSSLREYQQGDDIRRMHWASTARTDTLMVRDDQLQRQDQLSIVLDTRAEVWSTESFERAVSAAASIGCAALDAGLRARLFTTGGTDTGAGIGRSHRSQLLDVLARTRTHTDGPQPAGGRARAIGALGRPAGGTLVIVQSDRTDGADLGRTAGGGTELIVVVIERSKPAGPDAIGGRRRRPRRPGDQGRARHPSGGGMGPGAVTTTFRGPEAPVRPPRTRATGTGARLDGPGGGGARRDEATPAADWYVEVALAGLTVVGLLGFHRVFSGGGWVGPVMGTALGVQLVCLLTRRWVRRPIAAAAVDLLAAGLLTLWTVVGSSTIFGVPTRGTWHRVQASLSGIGARMQAATVPVHPTTGFVLLATAGAAVVALAGSWAAFRLGRTLGATLPSFSAFVACCCLGTRGGRSWTVALEVIAIPTFVLVKRLAALSSAPWFASRRAGATGSIVKSALPALAVAVVVALVIVPLVPGPDGHGTLGWRSVGSDSPRIVISPLVSLQTRLLQQATTNVFTVASPVASYWRLTSLDTFDGTQWNARDTYQDVDTKLPGVAPAPKGTRVVREQFKIQNLNSVWLPLAFTPEAVSGAGKVSYDARSGSLLTPRANSNHLDYTVTSLEYLDTLSAKDLNAAPRVPRTSALTPYLELPASVSPAVRQLAQRIVAGKKTEYAKAYALEQFFYGPTFTYSLHPPSDGAGTAALDTFLFQTRTGYCQQFAGAYAVLARAVGLPTRLAIGFTSGRGTGGVYQVTDADAHTWPEVWFPSFGWVPFEPTKGTAGAGFAIPGATAYTGDTAAARPSTGVRPQTSTPTTATTVPAHSAKAAPAHQSLSARPHGGSGALGPGATGPGAGPLGPVAAGHGHASALLRVLAFLVAALALLALSNRLGRAWRWARRRRRAHFPPASRARLRAWRGARWPPFRWGGQERGAPPGPDAVGVVWEEVAEQLAWHGCRRRVDETPRQFADRVRLQRRHADDLPFGANLHRLADILVEADFGAGGVSAADLEEAQLRGSLVASVLRRGRGLGEKLRLLLDPRLAWSPTTVDLYDPVWLGVTAG